MNDEECYVAKLNNCLRQNSHILRKDYSLARKYQKCLTEIDNAKSILNAQKSERNNLIFKLKTNSNSIDLLSQMINETNLKIDRVRHEIEILTEKIGRIANDIMTTFCSLSSDDEVKILQRQMGLVLLNSIKFSKEIVDIQTGFDANNRTQVEYFSDQQWSEFRME